MEPQGSFNNSRLSVKSVASNGRGLASPPSEDLSKPADMTLRHLLSVIQSLLMESQVKIALHVVNEVTTDTMLSSLLDMQLASAGELSHRFVDLFKLERDSLASMLDRMCSSLGGVKADARDNLLTKLETTTQRSESVVQRAPLSRSATKENVQQKSRSTITSTIGATATRVSRRDVGEGPAGTRRSSNALAISMPRRSSFLEVGQPQSPVNARRASRDLSEPMDQGPLVQMHPRVSLSYALGLETMMLNKAIDKSKSTSLASTTASVPVSREKNGKGSGTDGPTRKREDAGNAPPGAVVGAGRALVEAEEIELAESEYGDSSSSQSMMIDDEVRVLPIEAMCESGQDFSEREPRGWIENRARSPVPPSSPSPVEPLRSSFGEVCADRCRPQSAPPIQPLMDRGHMLTLGTSAFAGARLAPDELGHKRFTGPSGLESLVSCYDSPSVPKRANSWPSFSRSEGLPEPQVSANEYKLLNVLANAPSAEVEPSSLTNNDVNKSPPTSTSLGKSTRFTLPSEMVVLHSSSSIETEVTCESESDTSIEEVLEPSGTVQFCTATASSSEQADPPQYRTSITSMRSHITVNAKPSVREVSKDKSDHPMYKMKQKTMSATKYFMATESVEEDQAAYLGQPSHQFIIHPSSLFRMCWDCVSLVIILLESLILPMGLCFNMYPPDWIMWISTIFFTPDLILNFFTGYHSNGLLIMRHYLICRRYACGWFTIDFASTVPWEVIFSRQQGNASFMLKFAKIGKLMRVLRLLRIFKLKALLQRVEDMFSSYIVLFTLSIAKTVGVYCIFCHVLACIWGAIGEYDGDEISYVRRSDDCEYDGPCEHGLGINDSPWRRRYGLQNDPSIDQYLVSLQFATALLTGAELQLMPGRAVERIFVTSMTIVSFLVCSMIISQIVVIMEKINQDNSQYLEHTRMMRDFMVSRGMPIRLQTKVKRYLEYQFKSRKVVHQNHEVIQQLSPYLRIEIQEHMNKVILEHHPFFAGMEQSVLSQVCTLAKSELYAPGDIVLRSGQLSSIILFIVRGQLMICNAREGFDICLRAPSWIGDCGLFVTCELRHTVTCSAHSEILTIAQQDLIDLVSLFPSAEAYIKEYCKRVLVHDPEVIFCDFCHQAGHDIDSCQDLTDAVLERQRSPTTAPSKTLKSAPAATLTQTFTTLRHFVSNTAAPTDPVGTTKKAIDSRPNTSKSQGTTQSRHSQGQGLMSRPGSQTGLSLVNTRRDAVTHSVAEVCDAWGDN